MTLFMIASVIIAVPISLFTIWQFYLGPMKERVIETEKDVREIKTDVKNIREGIDKLEKNLIK